jgi:hypothetical protein
MGDMGEYWRDVKAHQKALRAVHGINCPGCPKIQPKRIPTNLLPGQRCKVCHYKDPRKRIEQ